MTSLPLTDTVSPEAWTADDSTFGARLALIRQRKGWGNVKEAALYCGVAPETWRTWERDGVKPRDYLEQCEKIAKKTGCDYGWLVDRRPSGSATRNGCSERRVRRPYITPPPGIHLPPLRRVA